VARSLIVERSRRRAWAADDAGLTLKTFAGAGATASGKWVEIDNAKQPERASEDGSSGFDKYGYPTQKTLWLRAKEKGAFGFARPEDVHTNPANGAQFVLADTGNKATANSAGAVTRWSSILPIQTVQPAS
jgi:secreted PhoX family phosphatase